MGMDPPPDDGANDRHRSKGTRWMTTPAEAVNFETDAERLHLLLNAVTDYAIYMLDRLGWRPPPLRPRLPWRGPIRFAFSGWFAFCPFDGGRLELSGVFGGSPSFASSSATRAISA